MPIHELSACHIQSEFQVGNLKAVEIAKHFLERVRQYDSVIKSFLSLNEDDVLQQAEVLDRKRQKGEDLGRLAGVPVALKDNLCVNGQVTTCASKMLQQFRPPYSAHVVERLQRENAILFGKCNLDEFAMGSSTENSAYQKACNPWNVQHTPGGSSGGSAAVVAASFAPLALGSDTGGSIRQPASFCGIAGMKPSYGRVSRYGLVAFASSLDQIGPLASNLSDLSLLLEVIAGYDHRDSTSVNTDVPSYAATLNQPIENLVIGVPDEFFKEGLEAEVEHAVREALKVYQEHGAQIVPVSLPHTKYAVSVYYLVATAEASSNLARYDGVHYGYRSRQYDSMIHMYSKSRGEGFGKEVQRRIMLGTYALSSGYYDAYYKKALQVRRLIKQDYDAAFKKCDVIMGPVTPTPAFKLGEKSDDPLSMYLSDIYTISCNLAGIVGLSINCGQNTGGLPIGLQILGKEFEEEKVLRAGRMFERVTDWHHRRPVMKS
ncbi:MAG: Asp-tRNA(Asn)/Glu-tRNA(Gln) amidotransferase subunit GatA [Planctomycetia bacterium]|nr:Asp-tRNA(Asn)/Glu-tRNA(Gln) amidotransferase subunit GatA [Planctomycetia bacterium]